VGAVSVPDWRKVLQAIPPDFRDNGVSSPFAPLYGFLYWGGKRRADMAKAARIHDFGYLPARLPGSGYEDVTRPEWDQMYRQCLLDNDHPTIARMHIRGLKLAGGRAWRKNRRLMDKWEWYVYDDFLRDTDKTYVSKAMDHAMP